MRERKTRRKLKVILPCLECGKGVQIDVFEVPMYNREEKSSSYWPNENCDKEVKCKSCGTLQEIELRIIATKKKKISKKREALREKSAFGLSNLGRRYYHTPS